jgi:hypothetical protein
MLSKMKYRYLVELIISAVLAVLIVHVYFGRDKVFEDLALGEETQRYLAVDSDYLVHLVDINENERSFIEGWNKRGSRPVILNLGNSQTHSINQMKPGEVTYVQLLHDTLSKQGVDLLGNSIPNANLQEFLLLFEYWKTKLNIKAVVIPLFMDDMRETGIRDVFIPNLSASAFRIKDSSLGIVKQVNKEVASFAMLASSGSKEDMKALRATVQESVEGKFDSWLSSNSKVWDNRKNVRGDLFNWMYNFRNTVFHITASTKRKMMPSRYSDNMEALQAIISSASRSGIKMFFYIPPIRKDVSLPYDEAEYAKYIETIKAICHKNNIAFTNLDGIVPSQYWGFKAATTIGGEKELDYMHFQFEGHRILADSLYPYIREMIDK